MKIRRLGGGVEVGLLAKPAIPKIAFQFSTRKRYLTVTKIHYFDSAEQILVSWDACTTFVFLANFYRNEVERNRPVENAC